jgi:hypothetical protein
MLNLLFSLTGGSVIGGLTGAQLTAITSEALDLKPNRVVVVPVIIVSVLVGVLAVYNSLPVCF